MMRPQKLPLDFATWWSSLSKSCLNILECTKDTIHELEGRMSTRSCGWNQALEAGFAQLMGDEVYF